MTTKTAMVSLEIIYLMRLWKQIECIAPVNSFLIKIHVEQTASSIIWLVVFDDICVTMIFFPELGLHIGDDWNEICHCYIAFMWLLLVRVVQNDYIQNGHSAKPVVRLPIILIFRIATNFAGTDNRWHPYQSTKVPH